MTKYFAFLDELRDSGLVNMVEAPKILRDMFNLSKEEAQRIFNEWAKTK